MTIKYRPEIDGLRAIAVLSVILFHSGVSVVSGGYVGVDVFFVISGYLITTIIVRQIADGTFSLANFYERRFRRLLPALFTTVAVALPVAFVLLDPRGLQEFGQSVVATTLFSANFLFITQSGYFDNSAELRPLLHTWSLAVEEQYYILFPLLLLALKNRSRRALKLVFVGLSCISLWLCYELTKTFTTAAFYLLPTRAWELLLGSMLAVNLLPALQWRLARELFGLLGLSMIFASIFMFDSTTPFPGTAALVPTLGTAFVIWSTTYGESIAKVLLRLKPMIWVGLISYSLYLWHWPVIVFTRIYVLDDIELSTWFPMLTAIFVLAYFSWKYVERPFRNKSWLPARSRFFVASGCCSLLLVLGGSAYIVGKGLPGRLPESLRVAPLGDLSNKRKWRSCIFRTSEVQQGGDFCTLGIEGGKPSFLLWGDSHALALGAGVSFSAREHNRTGGLAAWVGCPPLLGVAPQFPANDTRCQDLNAAVIDYVERNPSIETVILAARWNLYVLGTPFIEGEVDPVTLVDLADAGAIEGDNPRLFARGLEQTIVKLQAMGKQVAVVSQVPEMRHHVRLAFWTANLTGRNAGDLIAVGADDYRERSNVGLRILAQLAERHDVQLLRVDSILCDDSRCRATHDGIALYTDEDHLSLYGSEFVRAAYGQLWQTGP
jgi:peptidoglycan/LPS O-acetylase OafA/YrhL